MEYCNKKSDHIYSAIDPVLLLLGAPMGCNCKYLKKKNLLSFFNPCISNLFYNIKKLNTYFKFSFIDYSTLNITQIPKTDLFTFINNIGGGLGLFMGIAFPTLIEFLQFITEIIFIIFNY